MKIVSDLLLVPLEDTVVFPGMNVTLTVDVGDEDRVVLVPRHENEYAAVGTVAEVTDRVTMRGGGRAVSLEGLHRGVIGAAHSDALGRVREFLRAITEAGALADTCAYAPDISFGQRVELLETVDVLGRLKLALEL